jgi:tetratricopeptide (TPR) repeat protein
LNRVPFRGGFAPPLFFVVLLLPALVGEGGDWPPATLLIRLLLFGVSAACLFRRDRLVFRPALPDLLVLALWLLSAVWVVRPGYAWLTYQWLLNFTLGLLLYSLVRGMGDEPGRATARPFLMALLAVSMGEALLALIQRFGFGIPRPAGTMGNANELAELLLYGCAAAWGLLPLIVETPRRRVVAAVVTVLLTGALLATRSRGALLVALVAVSVLLMRRYGRWRVMAGVAVLLLVFLTVPNPLSERFMGKGDPYAFDRIAIWRAATRIAVAHPLGVGPGHFQFYWPAYRGPSSGAIVRFAKQANTAHSEFFSALSEQGFPGAVLFLGLGVVAVVSWRRAISSNDPNLRAVAMLPFISGLHAVVECNYHILGLLLINATAFAMVCGRTWKPFAEIPVRIGGAIKWAGATLLTVLVVLSGLTFAGWWFERQGNDALLAGDPVTAENRYLLAVASDPLRASFADKASAAAFRTGSTGAGGGNFARAIELEIEAAQRNPLEAQYPTRLAFLYSRSTAMVPPARRGWLYDGALAACDRAISLNPHAVDVRYLKAVILNELGRPDTARREISLALQDEPRYAKGWVLLGDLWRSHDPARAIEAYEKGLLLYYTYRGVASEPEEKAFLQVDVVRVTSILEALKGVAGP